MRDDHDDNSLYVVRKGEVEIFVITPRQNQPTTTLKKLRNGEMFGEFSFFTSFGRKACGRSTEFTSLYKIRQEDFLNLMADHPQDFEKFCMIRDKIILYKSLEDLDTNCYSCNMIGHIASECHLLHYTPSREVIIHRFVHNKISQRKTVKRRIGSRKFSALLKKSLVHRELEIFRTDNDIEIDISDDDESKYSEKKHAEQEETKENGESPKAVKLNLFISKIVEREENSAEELPLIGTVKAQEETADNNPSLNQTSSGFPICNSNKRKQRKFFEIKYICECKGKFKLFYFSRSQTQIQCKLGAQLEEETKKSEGTKRTERSELSKKSVFSPRAKMPVLNTESQNGHPGPTLRKQIDTRDIFNEEKEFKPRSFEKINHPTISYQKIDSISSLSKDEKVSSSSSSFSMKKKLAFMQGQIYEESYDKDKDLVFRVPLTTGGRHLSKKISSASPNINYKSENYASNISFPRENSNLKNSQDQLKIQNSNDFHIDETENEVEMTEFLKQFDLMKQFKIYFRHNNVENVIQMYRDPTAFTKKQKNSAFILRKSPNLKSRNNLFNFVQKKKFFKQDSNSEKNQASPLKRSKTRKAPPIMKIKKKILEIFSLGSKTIK